MIEEEWHKDYKLIIEDLKNKKRPDPAYPDQVFSFLQRNVTGA